MTTKAWVHAHQQDQIDVFDHPVQHLQRRCGIEHQTGLAAVGLDVLHAAMHMRRCIGVEADVVGTGLGKGGGEIVHGLHHQVHIDGHGLAIGCDRMKLQSLTDHGAEGQVRHVMVVHYVKVDPVGASRNDITHFFTQTGEVG
ncbi:hypothetical protein SDC9_156464 [bioreactor metagenome]|uniref:Uncharacterized protein n=1 Tax=bioreactor metagenome TaxID=1076179 RepID=A0A645F6B6_9ZZZZ